MDTLGVIMRLELRHAGKSMFAANVVLYIFVIFWTIGIDVGVFIPIYVGVLVVFVFGLIVLTLRVYLSLSVIATIGVLFSILAVHAGGSGWLKVIGLGLICVLYVYWNFHCIARLGTESFFRSLTVAGALSCWIGIFSYLVERLLFSRGHVLLIPREHASSLAGLFGEPSHIGMTLGPWYFSRIALGTSRTRSGMIADAGYVILALLVPSKTLLVAVLFGTVIRFFPRGLSFAYFITVLSIVVAASFVPFTGGEEARMKLLNPDNEGSWDVLVGHTIYSVNRAETQPLGVGLYNYGADLQVPESHLDDPILKWSASDGSSVLPYLVATLGVFFAPLHVGISMLVARCGIQNSSRPILLLFVGSILIAYSRWAGFLMGPLIPAATAFWAATVWQRQHKPRCHL